MAVGPSTSNHAYSCLLAIRKGAYAISSSGSSDDAGEEERNATDERGKERRPKRMSRWKRRRTESWTMRRIRK